MYYPIIRGRQYDLLALRELKSKGRLSSKIIPIIEPIKLSSTLISTVSAFLEVGDKIIVISNPKVGSLMGELQLETSKTKFESILKSESVIVAHHLNENSNSQLNSLIEDLKVKLDDIVVIHSKKSFVAFYKDKFDNTVPFLNLIPSDNAVKRQLNSLNLVGLADKYNKLDRNADYLEIGSEFFSEEHLYFREEGYIGFSDYSVVGEDYTESGFAPYAVAIHIVYPNHENALEIAHFVSDSNKDTSDPAGKFSEALEKLIVWYSNYSMDSRMDTIAMRIFSEHYKEGTYPGLPTLKKLSIMHHLELIGNLLEEGV
ncbi:sce7725 family protein [Paenibacillus massiliensis]|uniref:sce7725 family protein n=1 Tax=Paenibacillus massiliensis TaxID=225917 RepID=UPI000412C2B6|nr:sce7725 family protein [Paenibacillus massiliensis]